MLMRAEDKLQIARASENAMKDENKGLLAIIRRLETEITKLKAERDNLQTTIRSLKMRGEDND